MGRSRWSRHKREADTRAEQLRTWFRDSSCQAIILEDHYFTMNMISVLDVYNEYIAAATSSILTSCATPASDTRSAVQLFFESPVVRAAYGVFKTRCQSPGYTDFLESELIHALASLADSFHQLHLETPTPRVPWQAANAAIPGDDKIRQMAMEYLVSIEIWRRQGLSNGRMWVFGPDRCRYQFLASTLVQLWYMDREGCFDFRKTQTDSRDWNILWDSWTDKSKTFDMAVSAVKTETTRIGLGGGVNEDACFGVGRRTQGWLEKA